MLAGFYRRLDGVLMRVMDGVMSVPPILIAIAMVATIAGRYVGFPSAWADETARIARYLHRRTLRHESLLRPAMRELADARFQKIRLS